jgi:hypothetical protein
MVRRAAYCAAEAPIRCARGRIFRVTVWSLALFQHNPDRPLLRGDPFATSLGGWERLFAAMSLDVVHHVLDGLAHCSLAAR